MGHRIALEVLDIDYCLRRHSKSLSSMSISEAGQAAGFYMADRLDPFGA